MMKYTKSLAHAKQGALLALGKADVSEENAETVANTAAFKDIKAGLEMLRQKAQDMGHAEQALGNGNFGLSEGFEAFAANSSHRPIGATATRASKLLHDAGRLQYDNSAFTFEELGRKLQAMLEGDVHRVNKLLAEKDAAHVKYDRFTNKVKKLHGRPEKAGQLKVAEGELAAATTDYKARCETFNAESSALVLKMDNELTQLTRAWITKQTAHMQQMSALLNERCPEFA